ncbi:unnamed protein product [Polarella glacialis]|uniref:Uncharacterized protein n=1 Tax=Polarella glacialis TaxID=89957 RepID=A0A813LEX2_POLGL|nr:unnamed protein product [Polarella glacialis]CAE8723948.1 unnamed protein product [Polarella glacialis]
MAFLRRTLAVSLSLLIALSSASEDEPLPLSAAMVADDACSSSATCSLELLQRRGAVIETVPVSLEEQEEVSEEAAATQQLPDQFCRDRRQEGFHCDGKMRIRCIREGFEWRAGFKKRCEFRCAWGECKF